MTVFDQWIILAKFLDEVKNKTLSSCLQVCLARQWGMPTTLHRKYSIKKLNKQKTGVKSRLWRDFIGFIRLIGAIGAVQCWGFFEFGGVIYLRFVRKCVSL